LVKLLLLPLLLPLPAIISADVPHPSLTTVFWISTKRITMVRTD
jgi:hypothetical protein